jgi:hypothetical protein
MKIGILGSAGVGQSLATGFAANGHDVVMGSRNAGKKELKEFASKAEGKIAVRTLADAAAHGELLVLCTLGAAAEGAIDLAGPRHFDGKVVIDVTNPLDFSKGMPPSLFVVGTDSLGERIQRKVPKAKVVKCFNTVNQDTMIHPRMKEGLPDMVIAGDDDGAKKVVAGLLKEFGWAAPIDIGGIQEARWLEAFTALWVRVAMKVGSWSVAARFLRA